MLGPYKALHLGKAKSDRSLGLDYDRSPPHFQILRSIRSRDFAVGGLSIALLLSNVLATALAGLFSLKSVNSIVELEVAGFGEPMVTGGFTVPAEEMCYRLSSSLSGKMPLPSWTTPDYYILPFSLLTSNSSEVVSMSSATLGFGASVSCSLVPDASKDIYCKDEDGTRGPCPVTKGGGSVTLGKRMSVNETCWPKTPYGELGVGLFPDYTIIWDDTVNDEFIRPSECTDTFFAMWAEQPADPTPNGKKVFEPEFDTALLHCTSTETVVRLNVVVDQGGNVLSVDHSSMIPMMSHEIEALYPNGANTNKTTRLVPTFLDAIATAVTMSEDYPLDSIKLRWFNHLMLELYPSLAREANPNITHIPDTSLIAEAFETVYKQLYAINLGLYAKDVLGPTPGSSDSRKVIAKSTVVVERVMVSTPMFILATIVTTYAILLLVLLYWGPGRLRYITHDPTCLVGMWTALYASDAQQECGAVRGRNPRERAEHLATIGERYSYGTFKAADGKTHVGVFRERIVEPQ